MPLPILMYHKVGAPVDGKADTFLNVSQRSFARQMRLLKRLGYTGATFAEGVDWLYGRTKLRTKPACITFDDGYDNVAEFAEPVLSEYGWLATVFVPTAYVGGGNIWDEQYGYPVLPIMGWENLRSLQDAGWELAGHTRSHPRLGDLSDDLALADIRQGKDDIESRLGVAVRTFCYPFGSLNDRTPSLARQAGFSAACTTKSGLGRPSSDPFLLPRVKIAYRDDVWGLFYRLLIRPRLG